VLFEVFAPEEIKAEFDFPSREQWDEFAARLQQALDNDRLEDLAEYESEARGALTALRAIPGGEEYADWLAERLDYIEAAKQTATTPVPPPPPIKPGPPAPVIPHFQLWVGRMQARPVPAGVEKLLPVLRRVFLAEGLPPELVWLAEAESTFNPGARSPAGARGLFQLMPATAKELGLSTFLPDERTDPEKSARAAAQLLKKLRARFGDWPLALAAYNAGAGRVQRTLDKQGGKTFADIASALPSETRMYVPKVLATLQVRAGLAPDKL
jgi:membrane-bound lytic murein transglycosylase D